MLWNGRKNKNKKKIKSTFTVTAERHTTMQDAQGNVTVIKTVTGLLGVKSKSAIKLSVTLLASN